MRLTHTDRTLDHLRLNMAVQSPVKNETLFDFKAKVLEGGAEVPLSQYKGKVILVMNIASM